MSHRLCVTTSTPPRESQFVRTARLGKPHPVYALTHLVWGHALSQLSLFYLCQSGTPARCEIFSAFLEFTHFLDESFPVFLPVLFYCFILFRSWDYETSGAHCLHASPDLLQSSNTTFASWFGLLWISASCHAFPSQKISSSTMDPADQVSVPQPADAMESRVLCCNDTRLCCSNLVPGGIYNVFLSLQVAIDSFSEGTVQS